MTTTFLRLTTTTFLRQHFLVPIFQKLELKIETFKVGTKNVVVKKLFEMKKIKQAYGGGGDAASTAAELLNWFAQQEFYADDLQSESRRAAGAAAAGSKAYATFLSSICLS